MKTSSKGIELIKSFESCKLTAYRCPAGVPTIGYGHTSGVKMGMKITQAQADQYLKQDLAKFETNVMKFDNIYHWNQNQFDAMVSFAYNIGSINALTNNGKRSISEISKAILLYNKANGKVLAGLKRRREAEKKLFDTAVSSSTVNESKEESVKPTTPTATGATTIVNVNVRTKPNTVTGESILVVSKGKSIALKKDTGWGWSECVANGKTGYISNACLNLTTLSKKKVITVSSNVNMRKTPDSSSKTNIITVIKSGTKFTVEGIDYKSNGTKIWMKVTINKKSGWICYNSKYCK